GALPTSGPGRYPLGRGESTAATGEPRPDAAAVRRLPASCAMSSTPRPPSAPQSGSSPPELETLPVTAREDRPLGSYALLLTAFGIGAAAAGVAIARRDGARDAEQTWRWEDLLLLGVASHRVAMTIARDRVTTPLRAPFVH